MEPLQGSENSIGLARRDVDQDEDDGCANNLLSRYADARGNTCCVDTSVIPMGLC
jgi:hypothetical protein